MRCLDRLPLGKRQHPHNELHAKPLGERLAANLSIIVGHAGKGTLNREYRALNL
jgi:hypothetical protein